MRHLWYKFDSIDFRSPEKPGNLAAVLRKLPFLTGREGITAKKGGRI
jgi:hypothetical protein